jgi:hypothetical protein
LRHGKNNQRCQGVNIEEIQEKKPKLQKPDKKLNSEKQDCPVLEIGVSGFPRTDRDRVGLEI